MLLTKPLSTFLHANRSTNIHTLLLLTPTGKLLSSSSAAPTTQLRNQATIASSVWELYRPLTSTGTITAALPTEIPSSSSSSSSSGPPISSILIQLESGTMVIRALRCSLLFVVIGPAPPRTAAGAGSLTQGMSYLSVQSAATTTSTTMTPTSPPRSSHSQMNGEEAVGRADTALSGLGISGVGSVGVASTMVAGAGGASASVRVVKRLAEELAKCLDVELEGFTLSSGL